ncbi:hypothetical protein SAMN05660649_00439 [Desulfotomaculum arcticum]|uniref:Uncharacterized protein n=1 Tax=Desulfotruncus arcticus DSM 17038 TaxID=1121424 RepID=A0A1I2NBK8_9FIRM|nr:hypothetical protein [Desulfotruncus arcticus]SFG00460.1 hypothetical protein SAMN05660649_00439 [Desulfotomaculum arcticum] [Desulfotruncus arcticus DSM 17038]
MSPNTSDQAKRKMLILMIFAPGIFFIIYWFAIQSGNNHALPNKIKPPAKFETIGQSVRADNTLYTARKGSQLFTDRIDLKNNVAIAEPGAIFLGLGLEAADSGDRPDVVVISQDGNVFRPLDVDSSIIAKNFGMDAKNIYLYLFKVRTGAGYYYFQVNNKPELTWRIKEGA